MKRRGNAPNSLVDSGTVSGKADMGQSLSNAMMRTILADAPKGGAKRLNASLIASMIIYYWLLKISSFVSSTVVLTYSQRDGSGFAAPMLFGASPRHSVVRMGVHLQVFSACCLTGFGVHRHG